MPDCELGVRKRLAGFDIQNSNIEVQVNTTLILMDVVAVNFLINGIWPPHSIRSQHTSAASNGGVNIMLRWRHGTSAIKSDSFSLASLVETLCASLRH